MERRNFLKVAASSSLLLAAPGGAVLASDDEKQRLPDALGLLYDSTICIGCKACVAACKESNKKPAEFGSDEPEQQLWDEPKDLSAKTLNIIKVFKTGKAEIKDSENDGYAFVKRQCMHCVDPACVSACPATAMTKDPKTGLVKYNKDNCIGCRYCMVACPFEVPRFEWDKALPVIAKCELCNHRYPEGKISACATACPTGATIWGKTSDLLVEAKKRITLKAGSDYAYPLNRVDSGVAGTRKVAAYQPKVYGETDGGGTQCLMVAGVPFEKLGMPKLPEKSYARMSEKLQHTIYKGMIAPGIVFAGLLAFAFKNTTDYRKDDEDKGKK